MWETAELREIRVFLALAEELHFRRTADRLGLTQSRVSQSLRSLEHKLGVELVHRTSRRVALSPAGERFREEISGAYGELVAALLRQTREVGLGVAGELRLGAHNAAAVGASLLGVIDAFEAANERCAVQVVELSFGDRFDSLRRGEIDLMLTRLPRRRAGSRRRPACRPRAARARRRAWSPAGKPRCRLHRGHRRLRRRVARCADPQDRRRLHPWRDAERAGRSGDGCGWESGISAS